MLNTIDGPSESVEDYLCDPEEMPLGARESRLPCPEDCVLNDWGPWSRCSLVRAEPNPSTSSAYGDFCATFIFISLPFVRDIFSRISKRSSGVLLRVSFVNRSFPESSEEE